MHLQNMPGTHRRHTYNSHAVQAWLRMRGDQSTSVFTADTVASTFGVVEGSYNAVPLPVTNIVQVAVPAYLQFS